MPQDNAVTLPDSAPATAELEIPTEGAAYDKWRLTGELPSKTDESAASEETEDQSLEAEESATSEESVTRAASEAAPPQTGKKLTAEGRKAQLQAEIRELAAKASQLRSETTLRTPEPRPVVDKPEPKVEAKPEPTINDLGADGKTPKYESIDDFIKDHTKWLREEMSRDFEARQSAKQHELKQQEFENTIKSNWTEKVKQARIKYEDFDDKVMKATDLPFKQGGIIDAAILKYPEGADLAHYFCSNPEEAKRIDGLDAFDAHAAILDLKKQFATDAKPKPAAPRITKAPPPPAELGGSGTAKADPTEQALDEDDVSGFMAAENAKDIARLRRKKG